jgi:DNA-directed RNA polymerase alpha subunit
MTSVEDARTSVRLYNILKNGGISTLEQASETLNHVTFLKLKGAGKKSRNELNKILGEHGLPELIKYCHTCNQPIRIAKRRSE